MEKRNTIYSDVNNIIRLDINHKYLDKMVNTFKAIGDETRLKIITLVMNEPLKVSSISEKVGLSQSAVSHQLHILKVNNIVKKERKGKETYYSLDDDHVKEVIETMYEHALHHE